MRLRLQCRKKVISWLVERALASHGRLCSTELDPRNRGGQTSLRSRTSSGNFTQESCINKTLFSVKYESLSLENFLKRRPQSASCTCIPPDSLFYWQLERATAVTCAIRDVATPAIQHPSFLLVLLRIHTFQALEILKKVSSSKRNSITVHSNNVNHSTARRRADDIGPA
jgi:hypothetical protein